MSKSKRKHEDIGTDVAAIAAAFKSSRTTGKQAAMGTSVLPTCDLVNVMSCKLKLPAPGSKAEEQILKCAGAASEALRDELSRIESTGGGTSQGKHMDGGRKIRVEHLKALTARKSSNRLLVRTIPVNLTERFSAEELEVFTGCCAGQFVSILADMRGFECWKQVPAPQLGQYERDIHQSQLIAESVNKVTQTFYVSSATKKTFHDTSPGPENIVDLQVESVVESKLSWFCLTCDHWWGETGDTIRMNGTRLQHGVKDTPGARFNHRARAATWLWDESVAVPMKLSFVPGTPVRVSLEVQITALGSLLEAAAYWPAIETRAEWRLVRKLPDSNSVARDTTVHCHEDRTKVREGKSNMLEDLGTRRFSLTSTSDSFVLAQQPQLILPLTDYQCRSLAWMLHREGRLPDGRYRQDLKDLEFRSVQMVQRNVGGKVEMRQVLQSLDVEVTWGLTGTRNLSAGPRVTELAELMRVFVPPDQWRECQGFLDVFVRADTWPMESIRVHEHTVRITQTPAERVLYLSQVRWSDANQDTDHEPLLQLCSHFSPEELESVASCGAAVAKTLRQRQKALSEQKQCVAVASSRASDPGLDDRAKRRAEAALRDEQLKEKRLQGAVDYLVSVVAALKRNDVEMWSSCSICLDSVGDGVQREQLSVTACGHVFCTECITSTLAEGHHQCPECRQDITPDKVDQLSLIQFVEDSAPLPEKYGSKIGRVIKEMRRIHTEDPQGKIILWVQWGCLARKILSALVDSGVSCLTLTGSLADRQRTLADFEDSQHDYALLLALEHDDSGLNLVCANHVFFIHPVCLANSHAAQACERQAIGRCLRFGQEREVHVYRFATDGTIEEHLISEGTKACTERMAV
eukprot:TRINITY_DN11992_c0_g1_i2.p1 TRINITY_DN11992_c0_g1~~TRINITY_DN11992_c0_g1_i2.p1  ORF type:complete len:862 (+),score=104.62 TRINITY_DN11992_c0_g1_i2:54-2639(+)